MVSGSKRLIIAGIWAILAASGIRSAVAAGLLPNGDFEAGSLLSWIASERGDGITDLITAGTCFSGEDTTHLTLFGNHAAILKSGESGRRSSVAILTSDAFTAGDGVVFAALTGTRDGYRIDRPVHFEVRILNADGQPLTAQRFSTSVVRLKEGCPSEARDGRFYVHYYDTRKFLGQSIRIQFRQNTNTGGIQPFTLIDQVILFEQGEGPLFTSKPQAVAGISETRRGALRLDASRSFDPDEGPLPLSYLWQIDGESRIRFGEYPCIADLADGTYEATLFVNDGFHAVSDSLTFEVVGNQGGESTDGNGGGTDGSDGSGPKVEIPGCDGEVVATESGIDNGTPAMEFVDVPVEGGEVVDGEAPVEEETNEPPTLDLDGNDDVVSGNNFQATFVFGSAPVNIADSDVRIDDPDGEEIVSATIILEDTVDDSILGFDIDENALPGGIIVESRSDTSITLSGAASFADYEEVIAEVTFEYTGVEPTATITRLVRVSVSDGIDDSNQAFSSIIVEP